MKLPKHVVELTLGPLQPKSTQQERDSREKQIKATIEHYLPEFARAVQAGDKDVLMVHQDAFAAGYHMDELVLLGMAIKYAGFHGLPVQIIGKSGETC